MPKCNLPLFRTGCKYTNLEIVLPGHLETEASPAEEQLARDTGEPRRICKMRCAFVQRIFILCVICLKKPFMLLYFLSGTPLVEGSLMIHAVCESCNPLQTHRSEFLPLLGLQKGLHQEHPACMSG